MCKRFEKKGFAISVNGCLGLIRVVLCDDHDLFRHGLAEMLTIADDIEVVGEANTDERAVDIVSEAKPDAVLLDLEMPGGGRRDGAQDTPAPAAAQDRRHHARRATPDPALHRRGSERLTPEERQPGRAPGQGEKRRREPALAGGGK